jgi:CheY-like chemotaxis protein
MLDGGAIALLVCTRVTSESHVDIEFNVIDSGIGIPKDKQEKIFSSFSQADSTTTRKFGGTGLGLSIAKQLAELMSGNITVCSIPDVGSRFSVYVKLGKVDNIVAEEVRKAKANAETQNSKLPSLNILLAEDNVVNQRVAAKMLEKEGHNVVIVSDGQQACDIILKQTFDLVLMDVQMPVLGGIEATQEIRTYELSSDNKKRIPIIALTANALHGDKERCIGAGMDGYVSKPIRKMELIAEIVKVIR